MIIKLFLKLNNVIFMCMFIVEIFRIKFKNNMSNWSNVSTLKKNSISWSFLSRLYCLVYVKNESVDFMAFVNNSLPRTTYIMWTFLNDLCLHGCAGS